VSEQVLAERLVNCRKAYWCPAAPEARSAVTASAEVGQPPGSIEPGGVLLAVPAGLLAGGREVGGAGVCGALLLGRPDVLAGGLLTGSELAAPELGGTELESELVVDAGAAAFFSAWLQPVASTRTAPSTSRVRGVTVIAGEP